MTLPTPKLERWKYTNLPARLKKFEAEAAQADIQFDGSADLVSPLADKNPEWVEDVLSRKPAGQDQYKDMLLWQAANDAPQHGYVIDVPEGHKAEAPLNMIVAAAEGQHITPRIIIRLVKDSEFTLIETQKGGGAFWMNMLIQVDIEEGAVFNHYRVQENTSDAVVTINTHARVASKGQYNAFALVTETNMMRHQIHADLMGEESSCHLNGVNLLQQKQHSDATITVEHHAPNCQSRQNYRSVLDGQSVGVFQGKVHVHSVAQQTDGYQMSNALLLSGQATMNTKPELEIYADDVKCSHGTTAGKLDEDALFYMRARGIPENQAKALLIEAFLSEAIDDITDESFQEQVREQSKSWLQDKVA